MLHHKRKYRSATRDEIECIAGYKRADCKLQEAGKRASPHCECSIRYVLPISNRRLCSFFSGELSALDCRALGLNSGAGCSPSTTATTFCGLWLAIVCEPLGGFSASVSRVLVICKPCSPFLCSDVFAGAPQRRLHWQGGKTGGKQQSEGASQVPPRQDLNVCCCQDWLMPPWLRGS